MDRVSPEALDILNRCVVESDRVALPPGDLDRRLYEQVDDVLSRLGGKWTKRIKAHLFPYDPSPLLRSVLSSGELPPRNPTAFFPTPAGLVDEMLDLADIEWRSDGTRVLEPSAGTGAIARALRRLAADRGRSWDIHCCEVLGVNRTALEIDGFDLVSDDFMSYRPREGYDCVLMNPPFSLEGDSTTYVTHVTRAWELLRPGGTLVAVVPPGWLFAGAKKIKAFREWVFDFLSFAEVGAGAFKESGTMVNTFLIWGQKEDVAWRTLPYNGWSSYHGWHCGLWMDNDRETYERLSKGVDRSGFEAVCERAAKDMAKRDRIGCVLRQSDVDDLWRHYQDQ